MDERLNEAQAIVDRVHTNGGSAADAIRRVLRKFDDKALAARAARNRYSARQIGRALLELFPDPGFTVPYYDDCCCW